MIVMLTSAESHEMKDHFRKLIAPQERHDLDVWDAVDSTGCEK